MNREIKMKIIKLVFSLAIGLIGYGCLWYYYDWRLPIFILLCIWANNLTIDVKSERKKDDVLSDLMTRL